MRRIAVLIAATSLLGLTACLDNDLECGAAGALAGAAVAGATGGNTTTGAILGGAAGVLANDVDPTVCN